MDINKVKTTYEELKSDLRDALSRMERSDRVFIIRDQIHELQSLCPHGNGNYDFSDAKECPYCGKRFRE